MASDFDRILDECIDRLGRGESLESCLGDHPEQAAELKPLLASMAHMKAAYTFTPSADAKRKGRLRLHASMERQRRPSFWQALFARRFVWAAVAGVLVILVAGMVTLRPVIAPGEPAVFTVTGPSPTGNFVFMVSDEVNAIDDFGSLFVTVSKVGLLQEGDSPQWIEFIPEVQEFDLALLPGETTQELWRGDIPQGRYSEVLMHISRVRGMLKANGETLELKLPSKKLKMSIPFEVRDGTVTGFTYDLTIIHAGNAKGGTKYLLKPQVEESGATQITGEGPSKSGGQDKDSTGPRPKTKEK